MTGVFRTIAQNAFANALQRVLQRHVSDNEKAITIWMEILDLKEFGDLSPPTGAEGKTE